MNREERSFEFTIDNLETLSIKNNWCSWCVNVFVSDQTGEWNSCGTGLLSFFGKKKQENILTKVSSVKDIKKEEAGRIVLCSLGFQYVHPAGSIKEKPLK